MKYCSNALSSGWTSDTLDYCTVVPELDAYFDFAPPGGWLEQELVFHPEALEVNSCPLFHADMRLISSAVTADPPRGHEWFGGGVDGRPDLDELPVCPLSMLQSVSARGTRAGELVRSVYQLHGRSSSTSSGCS